MCYVRCCCTILCSVFVPLLLLLFFLHIFSSRYCLLRHHKHRKQKKSFFSLWSLFLRQKLDNYAASCCFFLLLFFSCFFASHRSLHPFCTPVKIAPRSKQPISFGHQKKSGSLSPEASPREFSCPFPSLLFLLLFFLHLCFSAFASLLLFVCFSLRTFCSAWKSKRPLARTHTRVHTDAHSSMAARLLCL